MNGLRVTYRVERVPFCGSCLTGARNERGARKIHEQNVNFTLHIGRGYGP